MSGEIEFDKCEVCGKETELQRTYFRYDVKCECHSPNHFELVRHCIDCVPEEPKYTKISVKTEDLHNPYAMAMSVVIKELNSDKSGGSMYYGWQSSIACTIMDNSDIGHEKANEIAVKFLELLLHERQG